MKKAPDAGGRPIVLKIPEAKGAVKLVKWKTGRPGIEVGGVGLRRGFFGTYLVPAKNGSPIRIQVRGSMPGYLRVYRGREELANTGRAPGWMWTITLLPVLLLLIIQGLIGFAVAFGLIFANRAIVSKETWPVALRIVLPSMIFFMVFVVELQLAIALYGLGDTAT